jgi:Ferredoxin-like domain in Api92-like protein
MPNWCYNNLTLTHSDSLKVNALYKNGKSNVFQHLRPRPVSEDLNWYGWNLHNWGTKWDIDPEYFELESDNTIILGFDSAWAPPIQLYDFLVSEGWEVTAYYSEPGMCFCGKYQNGADSCFEYTDEKSIDKIPTDIAEFANLYEMFAEEVNENE